VRGASGNRCPYRDPCRHFWLFCCVLDEAGEIIPEQKVATTPKAMK
jgi:hypothetical protein